MRPIFLVFALSTFLAACAPPISSPGVGPDGQPLPSIYRIRPADKSAITFRMLDNLNVLRREAGVPEVELNAQLTAAAATHARDMAVQNRAWTFGSDGSSTFERVRRTGYRGTARGEVVRETYEAELQTLAVWVDDEEAPGTRAVILDRNAREIGFSWFQEPNGKIWWSLVLGDGKPAEGA